MPQEGYTVQHRYILEFKKKNSAQKLPCYDNGDNNANIVRYCKIWGIQTDPRLKTNINFGQQEGLTVLQFKEN